MPFAWTAVYLMNVINSANSLDAEKEQQSRSDSLGLSILLTMMYCILPLARMLLELIVIYKCTAVLSKYVFMNYSSCAKSNWR